MAAVSGRGPWGLFSEIQHTYIRLVKKWAETGWKSSVCMGAWIWVHASEAPTEVRWAAPICACVWGGVGIFDKGKKEARSTIFAKSTGKMKSFWNVYFGAHQSRGYFHDLLSSLLLICLSLQCSSIIIDMIQALISVSRSFQVSRGTFVICRCTNTNTASIVAINHLIICCFFFLYTTIPHLHYSGEILLCCDWWSCIILGWDWLLSLGRQAGDSWSNWLLSCYGFPACCWCSRERVSLHCTHTRTEVIKHSLLHTHARTPTALSD